LGIQRKLEEKWETSYFNQKLTSIMRVVEFLEGSLNDKN